MRERFPTFGSRVGFFYVSALRMSSKFKIVLLTWGEFAHDREKFRGNMGRRKVNRRLHILDIILPINN